MKRITVAGSFIAGVAACIFLLYIQGFQENQKVKPVTTSMLPWLERFSVPVTPDTMSFAGEAVPMSRREMREPADAL